MADEWIVVASFQSPLAAQIALGRLGDEGIEAFSSGDLSAAVFSGVSAVGGPVELQVRAEDAEAARTLLAELEGPLDPVWETEAESDVWLCSLCGEPIATDLGACPSCRTPRDAIRTKQPTTLVQQRPSAARGKEGIERRDQVVAGPPVVRAQDLLEDAPEMANPETFLSDDLARRALRAALIGCILGPSLSFYSLWLTLRLCLMPGELSPQNSGRIRWAFLLNGLILFVWSVLLSGFYYWD